MPNQQTDFSLQPSDIDLMGKELGELYAALYVQLVWLHRKWGEYSAMFAIGPERVDLMNKVAPAFFSHLQTVLWHDLVLHLARMTDPPKSMGKPNLTFQGLIDCIDKEPVRQQVQEYVGRAIDASNFARVYRNRQIAHVDLDLALKRVTDLPKSGSRSDIESALIPLDNALNAISQAYKNTTTLFHFAQEWQPGDAHAMLHHLKLGHQAEMEIRDQILKGGLVPVGKDLDAA